MEDVYDSDDNLLEDLIKSRAIKHNIEYGEYDQDLLKLYFDQDMLKEFEGLDIGLDNYFNESQNQIIDQEELDEQDLSPPPENPIFVLGDLIQIQANGNTYKMLCGSALEVDCYQKLLGDQEADLLLTDPPYNVAVQNSQGMKIANDDMGKEEFNQFMTDFYNSVVLYCRKGAVAYIFHSESERVIFTDEFVNAGFKMAQVIIWVKSSSTMSRQDYNWRHEPILYGWKEGAGHYFNLDFTNTTVIDEENVDLKKLSKPELINRLLNYQHKLPESVIYEDKTLHNTDHPTMKPVRIIKKFIVNSSKPQDLILEPFLGSGTTIMASIQTSRNCYGIELDPRYFQVSLLRILKYYKQIGIEYDITLNNNKFDTKHLID